MTFQHIHNELYAEDIPLRQIADNHKTPCYVYSAGLIRKNYAALEEALQKHLPDTRFLIAYACKANATLGVLSTLSGMGAGADIVSGGEMTRALKAGVPASRIVFSGVGKTIEEIEAAIANQIAQINVESEAEMELISEIAAERKQPINVSFRLNPDVDAKTHSHTNTGKKDSKFGISADIIRKLYKKAMDDPWLDAKGLSVHIGSQLTTLEPFETAFRLFADFVKSLRQEGCTIKTLDIGGGIGITYDNETLFDLNDYVRLIQEHIAPLETDIILEPGRFLTGDTGLLLSRVLYSKKAGDKTFLIVDAGMTDFMRPSLYDAVHPVVPVKKESDETKPGEKIYDIAGPVCETADVLARNVSLSPKLETPGSLIVFMMAGAYGSVMASMYNARALPSEILVDGQNIQEIRKRFDVHDLMNLETVPDWLEK